jgi:hypothetical protein
MLHSAVVLSGGLANKSQVRHAGTGRFLNQNVRWVPQPKCAVCCCFAGMSSTRTSLGSAPIASIAVDCLPLNPEACFPRCWVGDCAGSLHVVRASPGNIRHQLQVLHHDGPLSDPAAAAWGPQVAPAAPIKALLGQDDLMFCAGGRVAADCLRMWDANTHSVLLQANCQVYGNINCFAVIPWGEGPAVSASFAPEASCKGRGSGSCSYDSWCLLSGHDKGQVVVWQVKQPTPGKRMLQALLFVEPAANR